MKNAGLGGRQSQRLTLFMDATPKICSILDASEKRASSVGGLAPVGNVGFDRPLSQPVLMQSECDDTAYQDCDSHSVVPPGQSSSEKN